MSCLFLFLTKSLMQILENSELSLFIVILIRGDSKFTSIAGHYKPLKNYFIVFPLRRIKRHIIIKTLMKY